MSFRIVPRYFKRQREINSAVLMKRGNFSKFFEGSKDGRNNSKNPLSYSYSQLGFSGFTKTICKHFQSPLAPQLPAACVASTTGCSSSRPFKTSECFVADNGGGWCGSVDVQIRRRSNAAFLGHSNIQARSDAATYFSSTFKHFLGILLSQGQESSSLGGNCRKLGKKWIPKCGSASSPNR